MDSCFPTVDNQPLATQEFSYRHSDASVSRKLHLIKKKYNEFNNEGHPATENSLQLSQG